jgi:hypothetical protein
MEWKTLSLHQRWLLEKLLGEEKMAAAHDSRLQIRSLPESGCYRLGYIEEADEIRRGFAASMYVGDASDNDGVPIQAVLVVDGNGLPYELEILRLDGGELQLPMDQLQFSFVRE